MVQDAPQSRSWDQRRGGGRAVQLRRHDYTGARVRYFRADTGTGAIGTQAAGGPVRLTRAESRLREEKATPGWTRRMRPSPAMGGGKRHGGVDRTGHHRGAVLGVGRRYGE